MTNQSVNETRELKNTEFLNNFTGIYMPYFEYDVELGASTIKGTTKESHSNYDLVHTYQIDDGANLLTDEQEASLQEKYAALTRYMDAAFITTNSASGSTAPFAERYAINHYGNDPAVLFIIDMDNRQVYVYANGTALQTISRADARAITDNIYKYATAGDYYTCTEKAFDQILAVLRRKAALPAGEAHHQRHHYYNQNDFIGDLLADFLGAEESADFSLDNGQICRWMNGLSKVSPKISRFYLDKGNQIILAAQISNTFIPIMSDSAMAVQELYDLLMQDYTVSEEKKALLCRDYPCKDNRTKGLFMAELICFGMEREFVKRDIRMKNLLASGNLSPAVSDYIFDKGVPHPCRNFCGRDQELTEIHDLLIDHNKVSLHGIPGIGKSELAKAYAKIHKKDYTNILYLTYSGNLKKDITDLAFADDQSAGSEDERFRKHNRFLRALKDDSLIIIDNFNTTSARDEFLPIVLKYRCRILFTTRSTLPGQTCFLVSEIKDKETLFQLAGKFYADAKIYRPIIEEIIDTVHCHTLAVELAARLLEAGMLNPDEVLNKLRKERAAFDATDKINLSKDGRSQRATYYDHIHTLFSLFRLSETEKGIMRSLSLILLTGISARLFGRWLDFTDLNEINELIELGFIQEKTGRCISLHPMIQEVTTTELTPGIENCHAMLENIRAACQLHGLNVSYYKLMFQTVENTIRIAIKDDDAFYQLLLQDVFAYMESYNYQNGMQMILDELKKLQNTSPSSTTADKALLLDNQAAMEKDPKKAARLLQEAIALLPEVNSGNALLVSNLQANLGGMYRLTGNYVLAKQYMESAILLNDMGYPRQGLTGLQKIEPVVTKQSPLSLDYATIQQSMGYLNLSCGETSQALECFQKALAIFAKIYENEPELLAEKKDEIAPALQKAKLLPTVLPMLNG